MAYKRKTVDCYAIEGNCGYGWDIECYCEDIVYEKTCIVIPGMYIYTNLFGN